MSSDLYVDPVERVRSAGGAFSVATLAALKALTTRPALVESYGRASTNDGGGGTWTFRTGDQSANVTADPLSGLWAAPDTAPTGASGAWQRIYTDALEAVWFGVVADGVTSNTTAMQAALDALPATGGVLNLPDGSVLTGPLTLSGKDNVTLAGRGREKTKFLLSSAGVLLTVSGADWWVVKDTSFHLNGTAQAIAGTTGVLFNSASSNCTVERCNFIGFADDGLYFEGTIGTQLSGNKAVECYFLGNGRHQLRGFYNNDFHIERCQAGSLDGVTHATTGCYLDNCSAGSYSGNYHWNNVRGFQAVSCNYNEYALNRFENSDQQGVYIDSGSYCSFVGNRVHTNSLTTSGASDSVYIVNATRIIFANNNIFSWDATFSRWGVNFDGTCTGAEGGNSIHGYDTANFGPIRFAGTSSVAGLGGDLVIPLCTLTTVAGGATVYLGVNGSDATESNVYWVAGRRYAILYMWVAATADPGVGQTYTYTLRIDAIDTAMVATMSGAGAFAADAPTTAPQQLVDVGETVTVKLVTSATAAVAAHRGYIVLAEY